MPLVNIDDADGTLTVTLTGRDPVALDLFVAHDTFCAAIDGWDARKDGPIEEKVAALKDYYARLQTAAAGLGLGVVTGTTAQRIQEAVRTGMDDLRKKAAAGSPAPTP